MLRPNSKRALPDDPLSNEEHHIQHTAAQAPHTGNHSAVYGFGTTCTCRARILTPINQAFLDGFHKLPESSRD